MRLDLRTSAVGWTAVVVDPQALEHFWSRDHSFCMSYGDAPMCDWFGNYQDAHPAEFVPAAAHFGKGSKDELRLHLNNGRQRTRWQLECASTEVVVALPTDQLNAAVHAGLVQRILGRGDSADIGHDLDRQAMTHGRRCRCQQGVAARTTLEASDDLDGRPLVFLDLRDVLCIGPTQQGLNLVLAQGGVPVVTDLFDPLACEALRALHQVCQPRYVVTSVWQLFLEREDFDGLFRRAGLDFVADNLHERWMVYPTRQRTRQETLAEWLQRHHRGQPFAIINSQVNGSGLVGSSWNAEGRVLICQEGKGLRREHVERLRRALTTVPEETAGKAGAD
jgi:hypothetical protein